MVLQREKPVPVWGKASAGEKVSVRFGGQTHEATAGTDGRWMVRLNPMPANAAGQILTVEGANKVELADVLVGEVWLGSGQSNMEWSVNRSDNGAAETAAAQHPQIRLFQVPKASSTELQFSCAASWKSCTPESAGGFSAVLYYHGLELHRELGVPVGLINSSWGGSRIEPWTPLEGFAMVPSQRDITRAIRSATPGTGEYKNNMQAWIASVEQWARESRAGLDKGSAPAPVPDQPGPAALGYQGVMGLYQAMIHPLVPYAMRGAVWYQGESNLGEGAAYLERKKALVGGWRKMWNQGDFPFYVVQLAPFNYGNHPPEKARQQTSLPEFWEAQNDTASAIPNTAVAVINDIGNFSDIHPTNKKEVGRRLSLLALSRDYGRNAVVASGPVFAGQKVEGNVLRLQFNSVGSGLATRDGKPPTEFEIAGSDGDFRPATAVIEGSEIVVSSPEVTSPTQVRHAWNQIPQPNLMNREGLPASAFRTR